MAYCPCKDCEHKGCGNHANCEGYLKYAEENRREKERERTRQIQEGCADRLSKRRQRYT